jgi:hypothetical protein
VKIKVRKPHIEEIHVKHSACGSILLGTMLEAAHMFYPSGLILLMAGGIIAVYEPYIIHKFEEYHHDEG